MVFIRPPDISTLPSLLDIVLLVISPPFISNLLSEPEIPILFLSAFPGAVIFPPSIITFPSLYIVLLEFI